MEEAGELEHLHRNNLTPNAKLQLKVRSAKVGTSSESSAPGSEHTGL